MRTLKTPVHSWTMNINYSGLEVYYLILYRYILWRKNNFSPWITENTALYWSVESLFSHSSPRVSFILIKKTAGMKLQKNQTSYSNISARNRRLIRKSRDPVLQSRLHGSGAEIICIINILQYWGCQDEYKVMRSGSRSGSGSEGVNTKLERFNT